MEKYGGSFQQPFRWADLQTGPREDKAEEDAWKQRCGYCSAGAGSAPLGGLPAHEYLVHTIVFLLHGAFVWAVIANAEQLVYGAGFGVWRWPPLPTFLLYQALIFALVGGGVLVLHVYLLGVESFRSMKQDFQNGASHL